MSQSQPILELGNPILRQVAAPVADPLMPGITDLLEIMFDSMAETHGVGIAAPQIGQSLRVIAIASFPTPRYPEAREIASFALINPEITHKSRKTDVNWEGCLSIPGVRGRVKRYSSVTVAYTDAQGRRHEDRFSGLLARSIQHEIDHLDGIMYLDRMASMRDLYSEMEFRKLFSPVPEKEEAPE